MKINKILIMLMLYSSSTACFSYSETATKQCPILVEFHSQYYSYWYDIYVLINASRNINEKKEAIKLADKKYEEMLDKYYEDVLNKQWRDDAAKNLALKLERLISSYVYSKAIEDVLENKKTGGNTLKANMRSLCFK